MKRLRFTTLSLAALLLAALTCSVCSCSTVSADTTKYAGAQHPPTQPANVQILRFQPTQPCQQLGEIVLNAPSINSQSDEEIQTKLREEGAKLGADAVVVVDAGIQPEGEAVGAGWYTTYEPVYGEKVVAKAIKYESLSVTGRTQ
jgi:ABC-type sugar transport system substrate-binding protein